jgi:aldehyde:ferredoxin oxidoreductase
MKCQALTVDLSTATIRELEVDPGKWLGGRGLATSLFYSNTDPQADPLGPDNTVVFAVSALTGTIAPTAGRGHVVFKSPLTGGIGSANSGGRWGRVLKGAGYEALLITGASARPVYLSISDQGATIAERVKLHDAADLWGATVPAATAQLSARHGKTSSVLAIGPAGENQVRYASLMNDLGRAYGRGGAGAVLGAKKLKAIVVAGSRPTPVADPDRLKQVVEQTRHIMKAVPATKRVMRELGTAGIVHLINIMDQLPHRNFQDAVHDLKFLDAISGEAIAERILEKPGACFGCPIMCARHTRVGDRIGEGPEYETVALMGPNLDIYDLDAITLGNYEANEQGLDTMSLGGALACAAELFERGAMRPADCGGERIAFGDASLYPEIVRTIAERRGLGGLLAEGSKRLAAAAGRPELAMQVKGLELPAYDPRGMPAQALGYMTSPTGACHLRGGYSISLAYFGGIREVSRFSVRQAALTAIAQQNVGIVQDSLGVCRFTGYAVGLEHWGRVVTAVTGIDTGVNDLDRAAERIATLERLFNNRAGFTRADDSLPPRFRDEPLLVGGRERRISADDARRMLDDYYAERGWDRDGVPLEATLAKLEL